jgi:Fic family protein
MLNLCTEITRALGQYEGIMIEKPAPKLRRENQIRTIQASLAIEGNTLDLEQVTGIVEGKRVLGSQKEVIEVQNAIKAYAQMTSYKPFSAKSLLQAHQTLMFKLIPDPGKWRRTNMGIFKGTQLAHAAPQAKLVPQLMNNLFLFIKKEKETHPLILSAIFHYELEFIHPFTDGNGRIGRLWQTTLLAHYHPLFEFTPIESFVKEKQSEYYESLSRSDKAGTANSFIEFSLSTIHEALASLKPSLRAEPLDASARLAIARSFFAKAKFSRKEYLEVFKTISTATASRDLAFAVENSQLQSFGERALTRYRFL